MRDRNNNSRGSGGKRFGQGGRSGGAGRSEGGRGGESRGGESRGSDAPRGERRDFKKAGPRRDAPRRDDAPRSDRPRTDRPYGDRPRTDAPRGERPYGDKPRSDRPSYGDKPRGERSYSDRPRTDRPRSDKPYSERPRADKPYADKPYADKPRTAKPFGDKPYGDKPDFDKPRFEKREHTPKLVGPLLWGLHAVRAAFLNKDRMVTRLMVTDTGLETFEDTIADATTAGIKRVQAEVIEKQLFDRMMPPGAVHQGVAALVESLHVRDAHDLIAGLAPDAPATIVILDQVTDPHNVGAILRSASAFGCKGVIMQDRHAPELTGVLAKAASGAADVIPVAVETNLSRAIELLQENDFFVIGLDEEGEPLASLPQYKRVALVLGAEGSGLRRLVAEHCDGLASLPTEGPILSLNVSNAAAVALYAMKIAKA